MRQIFYWWSFFQENDLNCILNSDDRTTHPDLFIDETNDQVTYFETGCQGQGGGTGTQGKMIKEFKIF